MDPLTPFVYWREPAPYLAKPPKYWERAMVVPVNCKTGLVTSRTASSGIAHRDGGVAAVFKGGQARFGARWLCGGGSADVQILADAEAQGGVCPRCEDIALGPSVYRCFDAAGDLIYIGSSTAHLKRMQTHETQTSWWPEVADVTTRRFECITEARAAERLAILAEHPKYNKQPGRPKRTAA